MGISTPATFQSSFSAVFLRLLWVVLPSTFLAERRPPGDLKLTAVCPRQRKSNLPAIVPKGRPSCSNCEVLFGSVIPSGFIHGDVGVGFDWMQRLMFSGQGPDYFFSCTFMVLVVIFKPSIVFLDNVRGSYVRCPTSVPPLRN